MKDLNDSLMDDESISSSAKEYAADIQNQTLDVVEFLEAIRPFVLASSAEIRAKGVKLFSLTLVELPNDFLTTEQVEPITTFYCDRLKDHHSVVPSTLTGLEALVKMTNLPDVFSAHILRAMFENVTCQSQQRQDRATIFRIMVDLCNNKTKELLSMGPDFVYGFINAMDGERDPRILLELFDFLPKFLSTFALGHLKSEAFEVIACYFPVDFTPITNETVTITRGMLAEKLAACLCGNESFAEDCLDLVVEKLDTELKQAKLDSLYLLSKASQSFSTEQLFAHFDKVWKALKAELLPGTSKDLTLATLDTLETLLVALAKDEQSCKSALDAILSTIVIHLSDIESRLFMPSAAIALKCVDVNKIATREVTMKCLPVLLLQMNPCKSAEKQVQCGTTVEICAQLLSSCIQNDVLNDIDSKLLTGSLNDFISCLVEYSVENEKLIGIALNAVAITAAMADQQSRTTIYQATKSYLLESDTISSSSIDCRKVINAFATLYPDEISTGIVNPILDVKFLTEKLPPNRIASVFEVLACLIPLRKFREEILEFLFHNIFEAVPSINPEQSSQIRLICAEVIHHILEVDFNEQLRSEMVTKYEIFERFFVLIRSEHLNATNAEQLTRVDDFLYEMSLILRLVMKDLDVEQQKEIVEKYLPSLNLQQKEDLYYAAGVLGYLDSTVDLENHFESLVTELTQLSLNSKDDEKIAEISNQLLCSLFNRCPDNEHHSNILRKVIKLIKDELHKHNKQAVKALSWISKGLLARGHQQASEIVDTLIELIEHPTLWEAAVAAFDIISIECPQLHLPAIKHFFQQKLFQMCMKGLWHKLKTFSENHVSAFTFIMKVTPHQVLKNNINEIGPILIKSLELQGIKPLTTAVVILKRFVNEQNEYFRDHLNELLTNALKLTTFRDSMDVRLGSIELIGQIAYYPSYVTLPFAQTVLFDLQPALDDHKRLVRNAAVQTRNRWYLIGTDK